MLLAKESCTKDLPVVLALASGAAGSLAPWPVIWPANPMNQEQACHAKDGVRLPQENRYQMAASARIHL